MQQPLVDTSAAIWTVTDGHAGNTRQARALAAALGGSTREPTLQPRAPWRWLAPRGLPLAARAFGADFGHALDALDEAGTRARPQTLAIGCGRQAALATRLLGARGARTVQILDPRIAPRHWDLVIAPEHDGLRGDNVISLLGSLNPVDDLWLANARRQFPQLVELPQPRTAVLLGGPGARAKFDAEALEALASQLLEATRRDRGSLLVSASRRTPAALRSRLRQQFSQAPGLVWTGDDERGENPYAGMLGWADRIVVTADSVNMLSEACATNAPVFVAGLSQVDGRPKRFVESLLGRHRLRPFDQTLASYAVTPLRETARVAAEVQARLAAL